MSCQSTAMAMTEFRKNITPLNEALQKTKLYLLLTKYCVCCMNTEHHTLVHAYEDIYTRYIKYEFELGRI